MLFEEHRDSLRGPSDAFQRLDVGQDPPDGLGPDPLSRRLLAHIPRFEIPDIFGRVRMHGTIQRILGHVGHEGKEASYIENATLGSVKVLGSQTEKFRAGKE